MDKFRIAVLAAMAERGVGQIELAQQCGLSQGHLSKVLRDMEMGRRTRDRLQKWLDNPSQAQFKDAVGPDDLLQIGIMLKRHCEELASISRRMRGEAQQQSGGAQ